MTRRTARRKVGRACEDCGWSHKPTRTIIRVCAECEKMYRGVICWPVLEEWQPYYRGGNNDL